MKIVDSMSNESPYLFLKDAEPLTWFKYLIGEKFHFAGPSMQQKCAADRKNIQHLARHSELNLNPLKMVDGLSIYTLLPFFEKIIEQ